MYNSFFQLQENPFNNTPDPRYLYLSPSHKEALEHLLYGINEKKGFIAVTGNIGMGKTTLCRVLLSRLDKSTRTSLIFNSFISDMELLQTINQEFGILPRSRPWEQGKEERGKDPIPSPGNEGKKGYIDSINQFLLDTFRSGGNAVLIIDEAQNLPPEALEQIRMLSNLETEREKLIQIILIGQGELREVLESPSLRQLNQRITVRYHLKPLKAQETRGYIAHRLNVAGSNGILKFTRGAVNRVHRFSNGVPRRINAICDRALLIAYVSGSRSISKKMIDMAEDEIRRGMPVSETGRGSGLRSALTAFSLLVLIALSALGGWHFKDSISRLLHDEPISSENIFRSKEVEAVTQFEQPVRPSAGERIRFEDLYLDEKSSIAGLFEYYRSSASDAGYPKSLALFPFQLGPEYFVALKRSFRLLLSQDQAEPDGSPRYLLIKKTFEEGAFATGATGEERFLPRSFILKNWGGHIAIIFPYDPGVVNFRKGMHGPEVLDLQKGMKQMGYFVRDTGSYDDETSDQVMRFQRDFGLEPDGIAGLKTRALLYGMTEP